MELGQKGRGAVGLLLHPSVLAHMGPDPGQPLHSAPPPPAAVDKQGLNFHPEFPELSTLRQIGNLNFYMKSDFSVLTANSNV